MRHVAGATLLSLGLLLAGCFSDTTVMKLKADGSGTIVVTTLMKASAVQQMKDMAKSFGGDNAKEPELFTEKEAREKAAKMGEGMVFVSHEPIKTKEAEGQKVTYAFKDITKLKINEMSEPPGGAGPGLKSQKSDPLTFKFAKQANGNSLLTIVHPKVDLKPTDSPAPDAPGAGQDVPDEQLGMIKEMIGGLKVSIQLEVAGKIIKTNSPHVNGSTVTVVEVDFDKLMTDMSKLKKLAVAKPKTPEEAKALIKDFPGVKVNVEPETTIEFSGN